MTALERAFRDDWGRVLAARNRALDRIRRDRTFAAKAHLLEAPEAIEDTVDETTIEDERLELTFTCCHPALAPEVQVALTLRTQARDAFRRALAPRERRRRAPLSREADRSGLTGDHDAEGVLDVGSRSGGSAHCVKTPGAITGKAGRVSW